jgi:TolB-like protein
VADSSGSEQINSAQIPAPGAALTPNPANGIFISYSSHDAAVADALCAALERGGLACWIAPRDVRPGDFYADAIVNAINASPVLVLVLSKNSVDSAHVLREVERASAKRRPIIAFRVDTTPLPTGLEYFLSASQWIDASGGTPERAFPKLIDALHERIKSTPNADFAPRLAVPQPVKGRPNRSAIALIVVVAGALAYLLADKLWLSKKFTPQQPTASVASAITPAAASIPEKSIAVLPFTDLSEKKDQEYFSDGLSEDLIDVLTKVPELHVPARASSFYFKGQHTTIADIAKALGVAYVLEGSVRKAANTMRVRTELIRADTGYNVWSETYDRDLKDIFKVQDEIAGRVVTALKVALPAAKTVDAERTDDTEAHNQFLLGRSFVDQFTEAGFRHGVEAFKRAVSLDPKYAAAYAGLADAEALLGDRVATQRLSRAPQRTPTAQSLWRPMLRERTLFAATCAPYSSGIGTGPGRILTRHFLLTPMG